MSHFLLPDDTGSHADPSCLPSWNASFHFSLRGLFYLASRGISPEDAERLFITASFEEAAINAPDQRTRLSVTRLAAARGIEIEEAVA